LCHQLCLPFHRAGVNTVDISKTYLDIASE
jgi:hypothetical protein